MEEGKNFKALTAGGVIPEDYRHLTDAEKAALETLSDHEVNAVITSKNKLGIDFFRKQAPHGFVY